MTDFSASNENSPFRTGECTFTIKNKENKDRDLRRCSSHNVLFTKMTLNDPLGSAQATVTIKVFYNITRKTGRKALLQRRLKLFSLPLLRFVCIKSYATLILYKNK